MNFSLLPLVVLESHRHGQEDGMNILKPHCLSTLDTVGFKEPRWICIFLRCLWSPKQELPGGVGWKGVLSRPITSWGGQMLWRSRAVVLANGQRLFRSPQPCAQNFHLWCSWWVRNAGCVHFSCRGKSVSLQGISFMRRFSQVQGLNLHLGLIAPSQQAASRQTTLHRMSLSVTPRTELRCPEMAVKECWARLRDFFTDAFTQRMR